MIFIVMKRIALILSILVLTFSCSIKKKVVENTTEKTETKTETVIDEESVEIRVPKSNISIFDQIKFDTDGLIVPIKRSIVDPTTNQTLEYEVTQKGEVKVLSITQADTISKKTTKTKQEINKVENKKTEKESEVKGKLSAGQLISLIGVFIGGVVAPIGGPLVLIPLLLLLPFILILRRIFKKKPTN